MLITSISSFSHTVFYPILDRILILAISSLLSANALNLVQSKILSFACSRVKTLICFWKGGKHGRYRRKYCSAAFTGNMYHTLFSKNGLSYGLYNISLITLSQTNPGFYVSATQVLKILQEKEKIAGNEQFLHFPQCFLFFCRTFCRFPQIQNCRLQTLRRT